MTTVNTDMAAYYAERANDYELIYDKPERQDDLDVLKERMQETLAGQHVLEVACGTGYWTREIAATAASVVATDLNAQVIDVARLKDLPADKVRFEVGNAFDLKPAGAFTACFAGFWWSHVKRDEQAPFLAHLRALLGKDALLVMIDNVYVEGSSTSIARTDLEGNTYQIRRLPSGERFEIVKNFPSDSSLRKRMEHAVKEIRIKRLEHYWMLTCKLK